VVGIVLDQHEQCLIQNSRTCPNKTFIYYYYRRFPNVFPYILNESRSGLPVNSGYEKLNENGEAAAGLIDSVQVTMQQSKTRHDMLTWLSAREYIGQHDSSDNYRSWPGLEN
jgi:hypothetical protein